jgi:hypothetical protein
MNAPTANLNDLADLKSAKYCGAPIGARANGSDAIYWGKGQAQLPGTKDHQENLIARRRAANHPSHRPMRDTCQTPVTGAGAKPIRKEEEMTRNFKALGLALVAIFAMSAMYVSTASAQTKGWLTSDGPATLEGTDTVGEKSKLTFKSGGEVKGTVECHGSYVVGTKGVTPHDEFMNLGLGLVTSITVAPTYKECVGKVGAASAPATVTMNGCDYVLTVGNTTVAPQYAVTADLVCPAEKVVEVHLYQNAEDKVSICTYTFAAQVGKTGGVAQNQGAVPRTVTLGGTFGGISATRHNSVLCGAKLESAESQLDIHALLQATNEAGKETDLFLSE